MRFGDMIREHQRLLVLRTLSAQPDYTANESAVQMVLDAFGLAAGRDRVRTLLAWLADQGLVTLSYGADVWVGRITQSGIDVAQGRTTLPGIQRPGPDAVAQATLRAALDLPGD